MDQVEKIFITVKTTIHAPIDEVWKRWTMPEHITEWNNASDSWHTPRAENNLQEAGKFLYRMEAKDGSMGFDFEGTYQAVITHELIEYTIIDGRKVIIEFTSSGNETYLVEIFEAEVINPVELQREGWQSILNNFKRYVEEGH